MAFYGGSLNSSYYQLPSYESTSSYVAAPYHPSGFQPVPFGNRNVSQFEPSANSVNIQQLLQGFAVGLQQLFSAFQGDPFGQSSRPRSRFASPQFVTSPPKVFVIDDFTSSKNGFQHGSSIVNSIQRDTARNVEVDARNIYGRGVKGVREELSEILNVARPGDVINLSQQSFRNDGTTFDIRNLIESLLSRGVRVSVAAGNKGPDNINYLAAGTHALIAESSSDDSGIGNIRFNTDTTSFAAASATAEILNGRL